ncbi:MarR family winged helix-turn-helix transcriptional regulator [Rhizobium sp. L1K21]|uniref:MarR family winged helix-turn-helix transcriptional regulator n=1 Tax=Rhizobium sp. L1K21 TaxID=2954933 RepID=UPI002092EF0A|nr:MarR family winged helix-turn-helix transcriptional regulator [Rhizobium sp. L1K21]MCO6184657.1 MarR family winged helix-turn-helix transcriptional regulator [Rhizobium sp. L1K21]
MSEKGRGTAPEFDLMHFTPYRLTVAAQKLSDGLARQYRTRFGISVPEWRVLVHLTHSGNVSVRDIEMRVAMEKSKVSRAASRLEDAGYIAKRINDKDRRLVQLALTPKGEELMSKLLPLAIAFQAEIEEKLGDTFKGLDDAIEKLLGEEQ